MWFYTHFQREIIAVEQNLECCGYFATVFSIELFWNKYLPMDANVDQHIRDIQRQYLDFLDDDVRMIIFLEISLHFKEV